MNDYKTLAAQARERAEIHRKTPFPSAGDRLTAELLDRLAAALESPTPPERVQGETTKQRFDRLMEDDHQSPLERLRCFCGLAMSGQDWLDVEPFFAALDATPPTAPAQASEGAVTDAMVDAYLKANDTYWHETDVLPLRPDKWRNGTPREATRVSLIAALRASTPAERVPTGAALEAAAKKMCECMDYPWDYMTEEGRESFRKYTGDVFAAAHGIVTNESST